MCGILGYFNQHYCSVDILQSRLQRLRHRGPDHQAYYYEHGLFLGHTRLVIIDPDARAHQPMHSRCGQIVVLLNGEIYNYLELKEELSGDYKFSTNSDTEVVIAAYLMWGKDCFKRFIGMFAICIFDKRHQLLVLARDHVGKKPLYYYQAEGVLAFASELKALKGLPAISFSLDEEAVNHYFCQGYISGHHSIYQSVRKLQAGCYIEFNLQVEKQCYDEKRFWSLELAKKTNEPISEESLTAELEELLLQAVTIRLRSDVPLGVLLSGGLDSSLIVAMAARLSNRPIQTFSIGFRQKACDETLHAKKIADHFQTQHTTYYLEQDMLTHLPNLISMLDEPFADSSMIPMYFICQLAKQGVTVALTGDGGDELFAGYAHYDAFVWEQKMRAVLPNWLTKSIGRLSSALPDRHKTRTLRRLKYADPYQSFLAYNSRFFDVKERQLLLNGITVDNSPEMALQGQFIRGKNWQEEICLLDFNNYLVDDILVKVDRMSMLHSLELRSPLLDYRIAELCFSKIPMDLKRCGQIKKYLLKQVAKHYLPEDFCYSRKAGFGVPLGLWFKGSLLQQLQLRLKESASGYFNQKYVEKLIRAHKRGLANYSKKLFAIYIWENWFSENHIC